MSEQAKFDHTVRILVQAYLNETLERGNCQACVVGNLIAHASGATYVRKKSDFSVELQAVPQVIDWLEAICTDGDGEQLRCEEAYLNTPGIKAAFDSTGYSFAQLTTIEHAFESNHGTAIRATDSEREFAGLMAVILVLAGIHGVSLDAATRAQARFTHA